MRSWRPCVAAAVATILGGAGPAVVLAQGAPEGAAGAVEREAALVQFYGGGSPLSTQEHAMLEAAVRRAFASDAQGAASAAQDAGQVLAILKRQSGEGVALARELGRRSIAFGGLHALGGGEEGAVAARIVAAHDPVVVEDPAGQRLVTAQTIKALVEGDRIGAQVFSLPPPGAGAAQALAASIRSQWPQVDAGLRDALSNAERDMPYAAPYLNHGAAGARSAFVTQWRARIVAGRDPADQQFRLAEVMAFAGATGFRNRGQLAGGQGAGGTMRAYNRQALTDRAGRALMPGCGAAAGSVLSPERQSFCQPSPIP